MLLDWLVFCAETAMAPHSSTLAWKIPWAEEPGGLQSMGSLGIRQLSDFTFTFHFHALEKEMATHSIVLAWRIPGMAEPGGLPSMGSHRVGHDWSDLAAAAAVFCDYGFSVSALWGPLATPTVLLGFLLPWGISSQLLQQSAAAAPYSLPCKRGICSLLPLLTLNVE